MTLSTCMYIYIYIYVCMFNIISIPLDKPSHTKSDASLPNYAQANRLRSYLHKIDPASHSSPTCPLCNSQDHITQHLFSCPNIITTLTARDLWDDLCRQLCCFSSEMTSWGQPEAAWGPAWCEAGWAIKWGVSIYIYVYIYIFIFVCVYFKTLITAINNFCVLFQVPMWKQKDHNIMLK